MTGKIYLVFIGVLFSFYLNVKADQWRRIGITSGGVVRSDGQLKIVGIVTGMAGSGGALINQRRVGTESARNFAPASVPVKTSAIRPAFVLNEVYVYPNPAKGGQVPIFHIETGIADSVKIAIYDVSGDVAHNHTITGPPGAINDGNGLEYAYEYAWRGHIPNGVYYYAIESQKDGRKLKKTGKFAVVR